jgi:hypothetical protein
MRRSLGIVKFEELDIHQSAEVGIVKEILGFDVQFREGPQALAYLLTFWQALC